MYSRPNKPWLLRGPYVSPSGESRFANPVNIVEARESYLRDRPSNLEFLLRKRYAWMNDFITNYDQVIELGAGTGLSKEFIHSENLIITDYEEFPWIDQRVDALDLPFDADCFDVVICTQMLHHIAKPGRFLRSVGKIIKPGGYLLVQDVHASLWLRLLMWATKNEGWSFDVDVFDDRQVANDPDDAWSGNGCIPDLLFLDRTRFESEIECFRLNSYRLSECLLFPLSGGSVNKMPTVNLPPSVLDVIDRFDDFLVKLFPNTFALCCSVVLQRVEDSVAEA